MNVFDFILDLIYPKRCVVCGEVIEFENKIYICKQCDELVDETNGIIDKNEDVSTTKSLDNIKESYSVLPYVRVKRGIEDFKFKGCKNNGIYLSDIMYRVANRNFPQIFSDNDMVLYVPIHTKKEKERGFNQAEILAEFLSVKSGLPIVKDQLIRKVYTKPQSGLNRVRRMNNIENAFDVLNKSSLKNKRILIIDDINTTGATLNECARVLIDAGAKEVSAYTLSTALLDED